MLGFAQQVQAHQLRQILLQILRRRRDRFQQPQRGTRGPAPTQAATCASVSRAADRGEPSAGRGSSRATLLRWSAAHRIPCSRRYAVSSSMKNGLPAARSTTSSHRRFRQRPRADRAPSASIRRADNGSSAMRLMERAAPAKRARSRCDRCTRATRVSREAVDQRTQVFLGARIDPLQIFDEQHQGRSLRAPQHDRFHRFDEAALTLGRVEPVGFVLDGRQRQQMLEVGKRPGERGIQLGNGALDLLDLRGFALALLDRAVTPPATAPPDETAAAGCGTDNGLRGA